MLRNTRQQLFELSESESEEEEEETVHCYSGESSIDTE